jgi:hypothetical protein
VVEIGQGLRSNFNRNRRISGQRVDRGWGLLPWITRMSPNPPGAVGGDASFCRSFGRLRRVVCPPPSPLYVPSDQIAFLASRTFLFPNYACHLCVSPRISPSLSATLAIWFPLIGLLPLSHTHTRGFPCLEVRPLVSRTPFSSISDLTEL